MDIIHALLKSHARTDARRKCSALPLNDAAFCGHASAVHALLEGGADIEGRRHCGARPLHDAVFLGHVDVIKILPAAGPGIEAKRNDGSTALHFCANAETARTLLDAHADKEVMNKAGHTPTDVARKEGKTAVHQMSITAGASADTLKHIASILETSVPVWCELSLKRTSKTSKG